MTTRKTDLEGRIENQLKRLEARLDFAKAKLAKERVDAETELASLLGEVESKRDEAVERLTQLRESGSDAWHEASKGAAKAWQDLKAAYNELERGLSNAAQAATN